MFPVDAIKELEIRSYYIVGIPFKKIFEVLTAWRTAFLGWEKPTTEQPVGVEDFIYWAWTGAKVDRDELILHGGSNAWDILNRLALALIVFPDGTFREEYFNNLIESLEKENSYDGRTRTGR